MHRSTRKNSSTCITLLTKRMVRLSQKSFELSMEISPVNMVEDRSAEADLGAVEDSDVCSEGTVEDSRKMKK